MGLGYGSHCLFKPKKLGIHHPTLMTSAPGSEYCIRKQLVSALKVDMLDTIINRISWRAPTEDLFALSTNFMPLLSISRLLFFFGCRYPSVHLCLHPLTVFGQLVHVVQHHLESGVCHIQSM